MATRKRTNAMRKSRRGGKRVCARNGTMRGGSWGFGYRNGEMLALGYPAHERYDSCGGVSRPGMLSTEAAAGLAKGLPGLSGGGRKRSARAHSARVRSAHRKGSRSAHRKGSRSARKQCGGRYGADFSGASQLALGPRGGTLVSVASLGGERGAGTPYPSPTECTGPKMTGGAADGAHLAPAPFSQEQTAGYKFDASTYLDSVGAPLALRTPVGGQMGVPACKQTGGRRRRGRGRGKKSRKH
jgi:hypothetical protein